MYAFLQESKILIWSAPSISVSSNSFASNYSRIWALTVSFANILPLSFQLGTKISNIVSPFDNTGIRLILLTFKGFCRNFTLV